MTITLDAIRDLSALQIDALREVANMGAGHAATALSQMTGGTIMISVPRMHVSRLTELPTQFAPDEEPVAAVLLDMLGDLTGRTLLVFPKPTVMRMAELMLRRPAGSSVALGELERSAIKEAGNILSGAYLNALSDFMGMVLLPSPPTLVVDMSSSILTSTCLGDAFASDCVFVVETEFFMQDVAERLRGFFFLLPDPASLHAILRAVRLA
jgi:chemotaxis protein CheC